jgi:hypothetical protein
MVADMDVHHARHVGFDRYQHPAGSPAAFFEADLQAIKARLRASGMHDPGNATALRNAFHKRAGKHAGFVEFWSQACVVNHANAEYDDLNEECLHIAFAQYVKSSRFCIPNRHLSNQSQSALAILHRAIPQEKRDDEWHAIDAVLRARERERERE